MSTFTPTKDQARPRAFKDLQLIKTSALPAAAANNSTAAIDLQQAAAGVNLDKVDVEVAVPATPSLVDAKIITFTIQDSANGTDFAAVTGLATLVVTGAGGVGAAAATRTVKLPTGTRRYIRANAAVESGGGSNIAVSYSISLLF
jgi:hypothetical protein